MITLRYTNSLFSMLPSPSPLLICDLIFSMNGNGDMYPLSSSLLASPSTAMDWVMVIVPAGAGNKGGSGLTSLLDSPLRGEPIIGSAGWAKAGAPRFRGGDRRVLRVSSRALRLLSSSIRRGGGGVM